jgi:long-chain acyl-CoA synthetase
MTIVADPPRWGDRVVRSSVRGNPTLVYEHRVRSVGAVMREGRRWATRDFIVQGDRRVTFGAHESAVRRVADQFTAEGIGPGDRVALFAPNTPEWSATFFATLEVGAIAVPCNGWWSPAEVEHAVALTEPKLVVTDARRTERLPGGLRLRSVDDLRDAFASADDDVGAIADPTSPAHEDEDRPAVVLFTSGTTGFPKGVTLTHRSLVANVQSLIVLSGRLPQQLPEDHPASVTLASLPLFHIGAIQLLLVAFVSGARLVFAEGKFDAREVIQVIESEGVTMWSAVPTMVERVLAHPDLIEHNTGSLRTIVMGGAPVSPFLLERVAQAFPNASRGVGQAYGLSEAGGVLATAVAKATRPGAAGRIVPVAEIRIDHPDEVGVGEILARSPAVMDGYWGAPGGPALTPEGWLHTGDLGRVEDGFLYIAGRLKDMIIRGGENIAPGHIEAYCLQHPDVCEAAVVGLPHPDLGEEVGAVVSLVPGSTTTTDDLTDFLRTRLAHFEVPSAWWVHTGELPKNDSGKILKHRLREQWTVANQ